MGQALEYAKAMFDVSQWEISGVDIGAIVGYFVLMIIVGFLVKDISKDVSDYVRMGCKSTWWLMGLSLFISNVSASTFTGGVAQAYMAGWSIIIFGALGGAFGWICGAIFFAPWMRRTRAVTPADAVRQRFGPKVEQIWVWLGVLSSFWGGLWLYSLAEFISAAFNVPMLAVIVFAGVVVVFYSVLGGSWSAQITDALQAMLIISIALVVTFLSLKAVGGLDGLFSAIKSSNLEKDYALLKGMDNARVDQVPGWVPDWARQTVAQIFYPGEHQYSIKKVAGVGAGFFTLPWLIVTFLYSFVLVANMTGCHRYLSTKSDGEARKSAILAAILVLCGSFIWYIPGMVGRVKYEAEINALAKEAHEVRVQEENQPQIMRRAELPHPADGAYAVVAKKLLPKGLLGLVIVAMFAATMAAMDGNLTGSAGLVTRNMYPPLVRLFGGKPWDGRKLLILTKVVNFGFGAWAIAIALLLYAVGGKSSVYDKSQQFVALLSVPLSLPFVLSFFVRRLPSWAPLVGMFTALINSAMMGFGSSIGEFLHMPWVAQYGAWANGLPWHWRMPLNMAFAILPVGAMTIFWSSADEKYRKQVEEFFKQRDTPVDFKKEVGQDVDHSLLKIVGGLGLLMAGAIAILVFFGENWTERLAVLFIVGFMTAISAPLYIIGVRKARAKARAAALAETTGTQRGSDKP